MSHLHNNPNDPNVVLLEIVAARLGKPMLERLVFVGGSIAGLLITDPMQPAIRPTDDVDLVVQVAGRKSFYALEDDLRALGFVKDTSSNAPCFCATKLEAFADRGNNSAGQPDYLGSHDMGDLIAVMDGRASLLLEIQHSAPELRDYLVQRATVLVNDPRFMRSVDGHVQPDMVSQLRVPVIKSTFLALAELNASTDLT